MKRQKTDENPLSFTYLLNTLAQNHDNPNSRINITWFGICLNNLTENKSLQFTIYRKSDHENQHPISIILPAAIFSNLIINILYRPKVLDLSEQPVQEAEPKKVTYVEDGYIFSLINMLNENLKSIKPHLKPENFPSAEAFILLSKRLMLAEKNIGFAFVLKYNQGTQATQATQAVEKILASEAIEDVLLDAQKIKFEIIEAFYGSFYQSFCNLQGVMKAKDVNVFLQLQKRFCQTSVEQKVQKINMQLPLFIQLIKDYLSPKILNNPIKLKLNYQQSIYLYNICMQVAHVVCFYHQYILKSNIFTADLQALNEVVDLLADDLSKSEDLHQLFKNFLEHEQLAVNDVQQLHSIEKPDFNCFN